MENGEREDLCSSISRHLQLILQVQIEDYHVAVLDAVLKNRLRGVCDKEVAYNRPQAKTNFLIKGQIVNK